MTDDAKILKKEQTQSKTFSYSKGRVNLNLTVRVDIKQELKDLLECLLAATHDVEDELKNKFK